MVAACSVGVRRVRSEGSRRCQEPGGQGMPPHAAASQPTPTQPRLTMGARLPAGRVGERDRRAHANAAVGRGDAPCLGGVVHHDACGELAGQVVRMSGCEDPCLLTAAHAGSSQRSSRVPPRLAHSPKARTARPCFLRKAHASSWSYLTGGGGGVEGGWQEADMDEDAHSAVARAVLCAAPQQPRITAGSSAHSIGGALSLLSVCVLSGAVNAMTMSPAGRGERGEWRVERGSAWPSAAAGAHTQLDSTRSPSSHPRS